MANLEQSQLTPTTGPIIWLSLGSTGTAVIDWQRVLQRRDFSSGPIDSNFGSYTHIAVYRFQSAQKLVLTGNIDLNTWQLLDQ